MYTNMKLCFKEFDFITIVGYQLRQQNNNITIFLTFEQHKYCSSFYGGGEKEKYFTDSSF